MSGILVRNDVDAGSGSQGALLVPVRHALAAGRRSRWIVRLVVTVVLVGGAVALRLLVFRAASVDVDVVRIAHGRVESTVVNSKAGRSGPGTAPSSVRKWPGESRQYSCGKATGFRAASPSSD
jgi:hypothetical protein